MERRKRRSFTPEFRAEAVRLVREGTKSLPQVAKDLDLTESALRVWVRQAEAAEGKRAPGALSQAEREELVQLRRENRQLLMGRAVAPTSLPTFHGHILSCFDSSGVSTKPGQAQGIFARAQRTHS
jgi:transposase